MHYQTVLITGVHKGLGRALTQALLNDGADVFGVSRQRPNDLDRDTRLSFCSLDLAQKDTIREGIRGLLGATERLDLVLLNAGVLAQIKDLRETSLEEISAVMDVNVWANKLIYDTLLEMQIQVGQLVAISSGAAINGSAGQGAYSISKSALNLMFRVYAHENPATHFTCLAPGLVQTQMLDHLCSLDADDRYPVLEILRNAVGTEKIQTPSQAARRLLDVLPRLRECPSGAYVDIRDLG